MTDAIIVLAGGISPSGELSAWSTARIAAGANAWMKERSAHLVLSGRWGFRLPYTPPRTEAAAMGEYAMALGIPRRSILLEERSDDTVTNAYFTHAAIVQPKGWQSVTVVTSAFHLPRAQFVFETIYGPTYRIEGVAAPDGQTDGSLLQEENRLLQLTREWLATMQPGASSVRTVLFEPTSPYQLHRQS